MGPKGAVNDACCLRNLVGVTMLLAETAWLLLLHYGSSCCMLLTAQNHLLIFLIPHKPHSSMHVLNGCTACQNSGV